MGYSDGALRRVLVTGTVTVTGEGTRCEGFTVADAAGPRETAILAAAWAIQQLQRDLIAMIEQPGCRRITTEPPALPTVTRPARPQP